MSSNLLNSATPISGPSSSPAFTSADDPLNIVGPCDHDTLQHRLKRLIKNANEPWTYAIFWESSPSILDYSQMLGWGDGYYQGVLDDPKTKRTTSDISFAEQVYRKNVLRQLDSWISGSAQEKDVMNEDVTDTEWFFLISMTQLFTSGDGLPGQAMSSNQQVWITGHKQLLAAHCERARQGQGFGLQTMVCIPFRGGVVELGSTELIFKTSNLMNQVRDLFDFYNRQPDLTPLNAGQTTRGESDPLKEKCKTTDISSSQELVDKQLEKKHERSCRMQDTAISSSKEVVEKQFGKTTKEATKCKTTEILLSREVIEEQFGKTMKEAGKNLNVSVSTLKRKLRKLDIPEWRGPSFVKRKANDSSIVQINRNKENNGPVQDTTIVNISKNLITIKAEYADNMIKFCLPTSQATFLTVEKVIGDNLKYLDEDGDWICLTSDEEMIDCIKSSTKVDRILVRLRVVPYP